MTNLVLANITTHIQCLTMMLDTRDIPLTKALTHGAPSTSERDTPSATSIIFDHIEKRDWRSLAAEAAFEVPFGQIFAIVSVVTLMYRITLYSLPYYIVCGLSMAALHVHVVSCSASFHYQHLPFPNCSAMSAYGTSDRLVCCQSLSVHKIHMPRTFAPAGMLESHD